MSVRVIGVLLFLGVACAWAGTEGGIRSSNEVAAARKLYLTKCAKCHKLYPPAQYSDHEWAKWMEKMSRKSKLKPAEKETLIRYIEEAIRHPAPGATAGK